MSPSATVTAGNTATKPGTTSTGGKNVSLRPFTKSSVEHYEPVAYDQSAQLIGSTIRMPDIEIPASGYFRALLISVTTSGGTGGASVYSIDAPFNAIRDIVLQEPNGSVIAQWDTGYQLMITNKYGAFFGRGNDPRQSHNFTSVQGATSSFSFVLRIPVEVIKRDALCALPNQNMAAKYRVKYNLEAGTTVFTTAPTTQPTVRVRATLEGWEQPLEVVDGIPQATKPPLVNSTMFHTIQNFTIAASGQLQIPLTRLGNRIRQLTFLFYDNGTPPLRATNDANFPDPLTISLDNRPILILPRYLMLDLQYKYYGYLTAFANTNAAAGTALPNDSGGGRENGVWPVPFTTEFMNMAGNELGDLWWKTLTTSRLEISGNWGNSGKLQVITNDIALTGDL